MTTPRVSGGACNSVRVGFRTAGPSPVSKRQPPVAQYVALGVLFIVAAIYQARYIEYVIQGWFGHVRPAA